MKKNNDVSILGVPFINTTMVDFLNILHSRIKKSEKTFVVTANPEIVMRANEDPQFMESIRKADYITPDGVGIVKAAKWTNHPLKERIPGIDTMNELLKLANTHSYSVYLLGAEQSVLEQAIKNLKKQLPNLNIVGYHNGFFDWKNNNIVREIQELEPDLIFVAMGFPKQEEWIEKHYVEFNKGIFMGIGGSFDILAGKVTRAPKLWQRLNLEWLYRLLKQPTRWRRMLVLPRFVFKVLKSRK